MRFASLLEAVLFNVWNGVYAHAFINAFEQLPLHGVCMSESSPSVPNFADLGLPHCIVEAVEKIGYLQPSPIQAATIPALLAQRDVLGQAQTGTGKTAAFALPIVAAAPLQRGKPFALVLTPTRELAIQVARAFEQFGASLPGFFVLPIYGGQPYSQQLTALRRGVQVVVGTPGRVIDHLERGTLDVSALQTFVLDEADEMLRMGFIDDVESVLRRLPEKRQIALFSATMPAQIRKIAQTYLHNPALATIAATTTTAATIHQRYWLVSGLSKLEALIRLIEVEPYEAMILFARTKAATESLAQELQAHGLAAAAIHGDMPQAQREKVIGQLKDGTLNLLVATDVAARGLDVERISHVLNYDIPYDTESYVHRIGRTGRAGRKGAAILFVGPRERGMLRAIERATSQPIEAMQLPTVDAVNACRVKRFFEKIRAVHGKDEHLATYRQLLEQFEKEEQMAPLDIAAALTGMLYQNAPLLMSATQRLSSASPSAGRRQKNAASANGERHIRAERQSRRRSEHGSGRSLGHLRETSAPSRREGKIAKPEKGMETYRIEVGHCHGVKPANIVGAIANKAGLESRHIGRIMIHDDYSTLDLPEQMPKHVLQQLKKVWVSGQQLQMQKMAGDEMGLRGRPALHRQRM